MIHDLKIKPKFLDEIRSGIKTWELRKNDRNYHTGDTLCLRGWDDMNQKFTGEKQRVTVLNVHSKSQFNHIPYGWVIMSIKEDRE